MSHVVPAAPVGGVARCKGGQMDGVAVQKNGGTAAVLLALQRAPKRARELPGATATGITDGDAVENQLSLHCLHCLHPRAQSPLGEGAPIVAHGISLVENPLPNNQKHFDSKNNYSCND